MNSVKGSCLCGAVTFECEDRFDSFHLCHCNQCQKISGSAHVSNLFTDIDNIRWLTGEQGIQRFDVPGRSISNAFCSACGSAVPYVSKSGKALIVPAGSLDTSVACRPQDNIFWQERAQWYDEGAAAPKCEGLPE